MIKIAQRVVEMHPDLDKDLLITGCIFHDIGKVKELKVKTAIEYTTEGHLVGHISMGQKIVTDAIEQLESFPDLLKYKIIHMILSHHGQKDWGSPVEPLLPEAIALHHIDNLDSKIQNILQQKEKANKNDKWLMNKGWPILYLD
jgi:3'-5' exoribonuclease